MASSSRAFGRERSLHEILGNGFIADVILWRRRSITLRILLGTLASWLIFEVSGYTLLSLISNVLLLLISILFLWGKAAAVLNRPPPPIPDMHIPEEAMNEVAAFLHTHLNTMLMAFHNIAHGKDLKLFYRLAVCLWLISFISTLIDLLTLCYAGLIVVLTIPALYDRYEECFDQYLKLAHMELQMHERVYTEWFSLYFSKVKRWMIRNFSDDASPL